MTITKLGHCALLIQEGKAKLLTDPGSFTIEKHSTITGLDAVIFTHDHGDHFHLQSLQQLVKSNPSCRVLCNPAVAAILAHEGIAHEVVGDGQSADVKGVAIVGRGTAHAEIHSSMPPSQNTGYFIGSRLWYPGDTLSVDPGTKPDIMALPIAAPWMKLSEALDYALKIQPKSTFPVHDMVLSDLGSAIHQKIAASVLEPRGVRFFAIELDKEYEF
jgi:L-ascorbate metabolism protein UlaG (beta-lactamase superfamily)